MIEKFSTRETEDKEIITFNNPRELFFILTGAEKQEIEKMGYEIKETQLNIYWLNCV